jgi:hypothetical protein
MIVRQGEAVGHGTGGFAVLVHRGVSPVACARLLPKSILTASLTTSLHFSMRLETGTSIDQTTPRCPNCGKSVRHPQTRPSSPAFPSLEYTGSINSEAASISPQAALVH